MRLKTFTVWNQAMTETVTSSVYDCNSGLALGVVTAPTSTLAGTVTIEWSNDGVNFAADSTTCAVAAAANKKMSFTDVGYAFYRFVFTFTSGSGNLKLDVCEKGM